MTNSELMLMQYKLVQQKISCQHCGDYCADDSIHIEELYFCCNGCKTVYEILQQNDLCTYYDLNTKAGLKIKSRSEERYAYLEKEEIINSILDFRENGIASVRFFIPSIHCSSCLWLLEKLYKIEPGINRSDVSFTKKEISITYQESIISLRRVVELLTTLGYSPSIQLEKTNKKQAPKTKRSVYYKMALAGFCASNIMLMSFPEYLGLDILRESNYASLFGYVSIVLGALVLFVSGSDLYISAWTGLRNKMINLDLPIVIGMTALFSRSVYEIVSHTGTGFLDSLTGLIFFLLIGKWYQSKVYQAMSFERDYQSYFPVAVTRVADTGPESVFIKNINIGDEVIIRSQEIIPADAILLSDVAYINYSFVTGESNPVKKVKGDLLYAGGRQTDAKIHIRIDKEVSQSHLLQLWNNDVFSKTIPENGISAIADAFGKKFTIGLLVISLLTFIYWYIVDESRAFTTLTSVLIVACPCALALSIPFAYGNAIRILAKHGLFLRSTDVVEKIASINSIVFDKTGTITKNDSTAIMYRGEELTIKEMGMICTLVEHSTHPLSVKLANYLKQFHQNDTIVDFKEMISKGVQGNINGDFIQAGSDTFVHAPAGDNDLSSNVHISINNKYRGCFTIQNVYRENVLPLILDLSSQYRLSLLSGDNASELKYLSSVFLNSADLLFNQSPEDKLKFIQKLQASSSSVLMLGDGLNDAGALKQSDVGISVSEDVYNFSPSCDGILEAEKIHLLHKFMAFCTGTVRAVKATLVFSLLYNVVVISLAIKGMFTPLVAAVIMPLSSVFVVLLVIISTNFLARKI